jgi:hypothetical protein
MHKDKFISIGALLRIAFGIILGLMNLPYLSGLPFKFTFDSWNVRQGAPNPIIAMPVICGLLGAFIAIIIFESFKRFNGWQELPAVLPQE